MHAGPPRLQPSTSQGFGILRVTVGMPRGRNCWEPPGLKRAPRPLRCRQSH